MAEQWKQEKVKTRIFTGTKLTAIKDKLYSEINKNKVQKKLPEYLKLWAGTFTTELGITLDEMGLMPSD